MSASHCHAPEWTAAVAAMLSAALLLGCGGERRTGSDSTRAATPASAESARAAAAAAGATSGAPTPAMIAMGDSIFHGTLAGGTCVACHGQDGKGSAAGPDLTDAEWLNADGSYESLVKVVTNGVPQPKKHPAPMPPMGGASLAPEQVRAVAAYAYSLSHPGGR